MAIRSCFAVLSLCVCSLPLAAQQSAPDAAPAGLETPWDVRKILSDLQQETAQIQPVLAQINPHIWVEKKGAGDTYIAQWQSAQQQLRDTNVVLQRFAQKTDSLPVGLDAYFRLEALGVAERSLEEGAHQYDSRTTADKLANLIARNFDNRQHMRNYLKDLAASAETNFRIADEEAQRCRSSLSRQPAKSSKGSNK